MFSKVHLWYETVMDRFRALTLLFALLGSTGAAVAQAACSPALSCCSGGMCPVHQARAGRTGSLAKSQSDGMHRPDCSYSMNRTASNRFDSVGFPAVHQAVLQALGFLAMLKDLRIATRNPSFDVSPGFAPSAEQPPRFPGQSYSFLEADE